MYPTSSGKDAEKLGERSEGGGGIKADIELADVLKVLSEGSVVVRVVPIPSGYTLVVVFKNPAKTLDVRASDSTSISD